MSVHTTPDVPLQVTSPNSSSERRITPSWSIAQLRTKLEPVTGVPPSAQRLLLKTGRGDDVVIEAEDEERTTLQAWELRRGMELVITDTRPPSLRPNLTDTSTTEKYTLPTSAYESRADSVLAWKRANALGRFDPAAPTKHAEAIDAHERIANERGVAVGKRCRVGGEDTRRGTIRHLGPCPTIPGEGWWVGVELDEPVGKNDGSAGGTRYFSMNATTTTAEDQGKRGVFVRPERVEVGEWEVLRELEELEEI
ncbi:MAG: hypothetical protein M1833_002785 [Piccolia ochrophora]|nr:MAG: hypothetical protein M1833_002785 [Piccolia ochrophora]